MSEDQSDKHGRENRGKAAGSTDAGEATGSGAGAGGGGNPEEIDADSAGGAGKVAFPDTEHPKTGGDANSHGSA